MNYQQEKILPCPFCGGINLGWVPGRIWCNNTQCAIYRKRVKPTAWNTRQAIAHASSASAEECSVVAKRLDALQSIVESGQRVEFAKSLVGNGVEIGVRFPSRAVVADNLREAIDQAIAGRRGDGNG